jgi:pilus assembly protein FimV
LNKRSTNATRFALNGVALAAICLFSSQAAALGLGRLTVESALGETLKAEIEVTSISREEASSLKLSVAGPDAYRAAGVDYNAVLSGTHVQIVKRPDGRSVLRVTSDRAVLEPFIDVIVEANWSSGRLVREYTMLFDPPGAHVAQAAPPAAAPVISPAPAAPMAAAPKPMPASRPAPAEPPRVAAAPSPAAAGTGAPSSEVRVRSGDTLTGIASRTQMPGISLDQMLVSLFRGNPRAFMGENMNRLKAGAVLSVPSAEVAGKLSSQEAREIIVAQSADFGAYRRRLAGSATAVAEQSPARQAKGQVQAQVSDSKQAAAATPDRLKLTQGGVKASAPEARVSKETESKDTKARLAELSRNVDELKKLQNAASPTAAAGPAPAPAEKPNGAAPTVVAAAPPAPAPAPTMPKPAAAPKPAAPEEPGLLDSLLDNPLLLPAAGVLVALLAGFGLYKMRRRMRHPAGETSFLESRLQPDSFFGASGGQRIDTREAPTSSSSSSMSYSLSQLDAIGDVDPVAEADVYLAYGRDLQAEEILKEAMRATPDRMAVRSKLLEVYAKRRDTKAFELLATQLFNLTRGEGEDWSKAQTLGLTIDPENPLYRPGAHPEVMFGAGGQVFEPLGASTVPHTVQAPRAIFEPAADATLDSGPDTGLDLDLGLDAPTVTSPAAPPTPAETTQPFSTAAQMRPDEATLDLTRDDAGTKTVAVQRAEAPAKADDGSLDFDLGDLAGDQPTVAIKPPAQEPGLDFGDFSIGGEPVAPVDADDTAALARKLELAEEFRQIGDLEGARDLLEEVVTKAEGTLKNKAQGMLDKLA